MLKYVLPLLALIGIVCVVALLPQRAPTQVASTPAPSVFRQPAHVAKVTAKSEKTADGARQPASSQARELFFRNSTGEWRVTAGRDGYITKLSGAAYALSGLAPAAAVDSFLQEFGRDLLGVGPEAMRFVERRNTGATVQVLYEQMANGLEVYGSRLNIILDADGNIVYLTSSLHSGAFPAVNAAIPPTRAASAARDALARFLAGKGAALSSADHSMEAIAQELKLAYRLKEESISLIYKATLPLAAPLYGDAEVVVDAQTGTVVAIRPLAKK